MSKKNIIIVSIALVLFAVIISIVILGKKKESYADKADFTPIYANKGTGFGKFITDVATSYSLKKDNENKTK